MQVVENCPGDGFIGFAIPSIRELSNGGVEVFRRVKADAVTFGFHWFFWIVDVAGLTCGVLFFEGKITEMQKWSPFLLCSFQKKWGPKCGSISGFEPGPDGWNRPGIER